jgi:3-hydroxy-9,10-secoandrosta-1,3,5(10)-triene-9,17-dione monooxygenase
MNTLVETRNSPITSLEAKARASALVPELKGRAAETERLRRLPAANVAALQQAGLFKVLQSRRHGGHEMSLRTQLEVVAEIARGCASTAWCLGVVHGHSWLLTHFPEAAQEETYGADPDTLISAVFAPRGVAQSVPGGFLLSGFWPFCSGCQHSEWLVLGAALKDGTGATVDQGLLLVPTSEVEIKDDWNVVGLSGTGSCSVVGKDLFVPGSRALSLTAVMEGQAPGTHLHEGGLYRAPAWPVLMLVLAPVALGVARGALEAFVQRLPGREVAYTNRELQIEMPATHLQVAEAAVKIDLARLLLERCAGEIDDAAECGLAIDIAARARLRMECSYAVRQCLEAVETLFLASGGSGIADGNPIQRAARDLHAINLHGAFTLQTNLEMYGRLLVGLPSKTPML